MTFAWFALAVCYLGFIFWLGSWGDGHSKRAKKLSSHPLTYSFALAIYCTAWTYFGAVGEAARSQWNYLPILLGPILLYLFGYKIIIKLIRVSKKQHITTIADLVSSRYGKRQNIALFVTLIVLLATIPYIALQLKAIGSAFSLVSGAENSNWIVFSAAIFMGAFCVFFGTRRTDVTEYRHGLMLSIAFESILKIVALALVATVALFISVKPEPTVLANSESLFFNARAFADSFGTVPFWLQTFIAAAAVLCLPRQFHVAIIDNLDIKHVGTARWVFPLYLLAVGLLIPAIATTGTNLFSSGDVRPDNYVLALASESDSIVLQALVFLGGLSAATAMIIVATLTLSTMISNDVILPKLLSRDSSSVRSSHISQILWIRRGVIASILLLSFGYNSYLSGDMPLSSIGLLAFSLVVQLLPAIVGGLYWQKAHAHGVVAGLLAGIFAWMLLLFMPLLADQSTTLSSELISTTAFIALTVNTVFFVVFSKLSKPNLMDKMQAQSFVTSVDQSVSATANMPSGVKNEDLLTVLKTFLGTERTRALLSEFESYRQRSVNPQNTPDNDFVLFCERALGGVIGASSSNLLISAVLHNREINFEQLVRVFDDTTQAIQTNQTILFASLESMEQGISVVDKSLCLVAWNKRYLEIFEYPEGMVQVGQPVEDLVRFNAERGECGIGEIDQLVRKRMEHLKVGTPHKFVRQRSDGRVIEMVGNPLPNGGFVTSFNDITEYMEIQKALKEANIDLEKRIVSSTDEVKAINEELRKEISRRSEVESQLLEARQVAEEANASKTKFLALASHDVLQPLNAAKLYLAAMKDMSLSDEAAITLAKLSDSVTSGESMIATLLEIARLDQGALQPKLQPCSLTDLVRQLSSEFELQAENKGLEFKARCADNIWVNSDPVYLQRIMRNLVSNAVKYTHTGKILLAVRRRKTHSLIQLCDTGEGIDTIHQEKIFDDFYRAHEGRETGIGLGLAVVARLSKLLNIEMQLSSTPGKGTTFSLKIEGAEPQAELAPDNVSKITTTNLTALCIDDDENNLDAMHTLLSKWGMTAILCSDFSKVDELYQKHTPNVLLVDYHLSKDLNGLSLIEKLRKQSNDDTPAILITAEHGEDIVKQAKAMSVQYLAKPVKPAKLRALLRNYA